MLKLTPVVLAPLSALILLQWPPVLQHGVATVWFKETLKPLEGSLVRRALLVACVRCLLYTHGVTRWFSSLSQEQPLFLLLLFNPSCPSFWIPRLSAFQYSYPVYHPGTCFSGRSCIEYRWQAPGPGCSKGPEEQYLGAPAGKLPYLSSPVCTGCCSLLLVSGCFSGLRP